MRALMPLMLIVMLLAASGCASLSARPRVVLVPAGDPVQLAEPVKGYVYVQIDGERVRSQNRVELPEGWWCLPDVD